MILGERRRLSTDRIAYVLLNRQIMQYNLSKHKQTDDKDISFQLISYEMLKNAKK